MMVNATRRLAACLSVVCGCDAGKNFWLGEKFQNRALHAFVSGIRVRRWRFRESREICETLFVHVLIRMIKNYSCIQSK